MAKKRKKSVKKSVKRVKAIKKKKIKKAHHKVRHARNTFFKKLVIIVIVVLLLLALTYLLFYILEKIPDKRGEGLWDLFASLYSTPRTEFDLTDSNIVKENCSDENLKEIWDFMFKESYVATGGPDNKLISDKNEETEVCNFALLYNINGDEARALTILYEENDGTLGIDGSAFAIHGTFTDEFLDILREVTELGTSIENFEEYTSLDDLAGFVDSTRSSVLENSIQAGLGYDEVFNVPKGDNWEEGETLEGEEYYSFREINRQEEYEKEGVVFKNIPLETVDYGESIQKPVDLTQVSNILPVGHYSRYSKSSFRIDNHFSHLVFEGLTLDYNVSKLGITNASLEERSEEVYVEIEVPIGWGGPLWMNITLDHPDWDGGAVVSNTFIVSITNCSDSDNGKNENVTGKTIVTTDNQTDYCIDDSRVMEHYCNSSVALIDNFSISCVGDYNCEAGRCFDNTTENRAPVFDCGDIAWKVNEEFLLNIADCFNDPDGDNLTYSYGNLSGDITILRNDTSLILTPASDWIGSGLFYLYANDSGNKTEGIVNFLVNDTTIIIVTDDCEERGYSCVDAGLCAQTVSFDCDVGVCCNQTMTQVESPEIRSPNPPSESVDAGTGDNLTFSITAVNSNRIEWRLDGVLQERNTESYEIEDLEEGEFEVKVIVKNGDKSVERVWSLTVEKKENPSDHSWILWVVIIVVVIGVILVALFLVFKFISKDQTPTPSSGKPSAFGRGTGGSKRIQIKTKTRSVNMQEQFRKKLKVDVKPAQQSYTFQNK